MDDTQKPVCNKAVVQDGFEGRPVEVLPRSWSYRQPRVRPRFVGKIIFALSIKDIRETADQELTGGFPLMGSDEHRPKKQELMSPCSFFSFSLFCLFCLKSQLKMDAPGGQVHVACWDVCSGEIGIFCGCRNVFCALVLAYRWDCHYLRWGRRCIDRLGTWRIPL